MSLLFNRPGVEPQHALLTRKPPPIQPNIQIYISSYLPLQQRGGSDIGWVVMRVVVIVRYLSCWLSYDGGRGFDGDGGGGSD